MAFERSLDHCSSSSSSSTQSRWSYDVFLSFRGEGGLVQAGIHTFRDDDELLRGREISPELLKSIQGSRISIVVLSRNYASSRWCLDELVKIIECKKTLGQLLVPIFYDVDPSDVRHQTGYFGETFGRHEKHYVDEMEKVEVRRAALSEAANLSGDSRVEHIKSLLSIGSDDVRMIGIYGLGGIGKTTIAKVVYNHIFRQFEGSCFLADVREFAGQFNGLLQLQEQLLSELLRIKNLKIGIVDREKNLIKERLNSKRVLIVLDDVDQLSKLNTLARNRDWFGPGSRIIITTRDQHLLKGLKVNEINMAMELNDKESLQLFSWHAFGETNPLENYADLANGIVSYASRLPLAVEVLGSYLLGRNVVEWKSAFDKLQQIPHEEIQKKLRISFDALGDDKIKDIFLDIAFFFIGMDKDYAITILNGCGFFAKIGISVLIDRCLLRISQNNKLMMHDLLRDMGREIICEKYPKEPKKCSRLWFHEDVCYVLEKNKGTEAVEVKAISANLTGCAKLEEFPEHLGRMEGLIKLLTDGTAIKQLPFSIGLLKNLRKLSLKGCNRQFKTKSWFSLISSWVLSRKNANSIRFLPSSISSLCSLTKLYLSDRNLSEGDFPANLRSLSSSLQVSDLSGNNFRSLPYGFSHLSKLEDISLDNCRSLQSISDLPPNLFTISAINCPSLEKVSDLSKLNSLKMWLGNPQLLHSLKS
ncbi:unnamed protein product [Camellia sinensis]